MKTHPLNVSYLVVGLVFLGVAGSWALRESGVIAVGEVRWLLPLTLIAAGVIGLVAFVAKGVSGRRPSTAETSGLYDENPGNPGNTADNPGNTEGDLR